jgi:pilus assembly protein CpaF
MDQQLIATLSKRARRRMVDGGQGLERALDQVLDQAIEAEPLGQIAAEESKLRLEIGRALAAYGPLQPLLEDSTIEEIWINSPSEVFVATAGVASCLPIAISQELLQTLIEKMLRDTGRRLDRSSPFVDASLEDGSRLHVVIPDITKNYWSVNIRKFPSSIYSLQRLVELGSVNSLQAQYLADQVRAGKNILVSGATQAGKTTMLCALLNEVATTERIITVEETFEIRVAGNDWVAMQTRQPNLEGVGEITLRRLVKEALRMRPGRIVVGEVREAESFDLLIALNSGLPGLCTIHANSAKDAVTKLCTLPLLAGGNISSEFVNPTVGSCIDLVVHCQMLASGQRVIQEIATVNWSSSKSTIQTVTVQL